MYKVIYVPLHEMGALASRLNEAADEGYRAVHFLQHNGQLIIVMQLQPKPGRPVTKKEDNTLGE